MIHFTHHKHNRTVVWAGVREFNGIISVPRGGRPGGNQTASDLASAADPTSRSVLTVTDTAIKLIGVVIRQFDSPHAPLLDTDTGQLLQLRRRQIFGVGPFRYMSVSVHTISVWHQSTRR